MGNNCSLRISSSQAAIAVTTLTGVRPRRELVKNLRSTQHSGPFRHDTS